MAQGDIINNIPFYFIDSTGKEKKRKCMGMMISNTCDAENREYIIFCPCFTVDEFKELKIDNIVSNTYYNLFYLPIKPSIEDNIVVNFSITTSISRERILENIDKNIINKCFSLNQFGYYYFIAKLTIHFMRPEDIQVQSSRTPSLTR
ncbi:MAG TPA: hypothetical protein PKX79_04005 [Spirochaetota bacterium]|nr:hypothetical protein [Spirochaetota bacterium]HOK92078.1 hypothetical protein [Spirochaetota bacterium]HON16721.1 hypothetical protein [Spirochaetota bacterium]HOQ13022.1 hypothetical protein [Spirochaetota bacterium]HOV08996.1 hypothetical protein [Spirochaetota bacterium]